ncbi:TraB/GumN family protein [Rhodoferax sp.]|jgi:hypothetical protein|uniref:TraB/GumN family protein n=1 Tax=Rhodoferax sp. TaxID=50421 RepID=UPI003783ADAD
MSMKSLICWLRNGGWGLPERTIALMVWMGIGIAHSQPVFDISLEGKSAGVIAGSFHSPGIQVSKSAYDRIDRVIGSVDVIYMESTGPLPTVPQVVEMFNARSELRMRTMITKHKPPCLRELATRLDRGGVFSSHLLDLPPYAFFLRWFAPITIPSRKGAVSAISLDDHHQYKALLKEIKVIRMEEGAASADFMRRMDNEELFWFAEAACLKVSQTGYLTNPRNFDDFDLVVNAFEEGNVDESRRLVIKAFSAGGWPEKLLFAFLQERDRRFASQIDSVIRSKDAQRPLFVLGAAHLGGADGVLNLLKKDGYTITPSNQ